MKDVHIVVVNYKMKDKIEACFASLFRELNNTSLDVSVVVVDNNSEDNIEQFLTDQYPSVQYIGLPENEGFGKAQNKGLACEEARYYFALNPDTEFPADTQTIQALYNYMETHPRIGMIGPKIVYPDGSLQYSCWRFPSLLQPLYNRTKLGNTKRGKRLKEHHHMKDFDHANTIPVDALMGSAMFVRGKAMAEVGGFDERFWMYFEDIDWCVRMWEHGWPVYYVHDIVITHLHGRGSAQVPGLFKAFFKNKLFRVHIMSWLKYMWKWRKTMKYYAGK